MIEIKHTPRQVIEERWEVVIYPEYGKYTDEDPTGTEALKDSDCLVRKCTEQDVEDWKNRSDCILVDPVKDFLNSHTHLLSVDRGDWGEGIEHFHISFFESQDYEKFMALCAKLREDANGNVA